MYAVNSTKYRWVNRSDIIFPEEQYKLYRLILGNYWLVNSDGDLLFWEDSPQCHHTEEFAKVILRNTQMHLDTKASVVYIDRAWVPVDPRDWV